MEGLEAIKKRIMADAREEAYEIGRQTEQVLADMDKQNQAECEKVLAEARQSAEANARVRINRAHSLAALEQRKTILGARQALIEQTLQKALEKLQQLPEIEKASLYARLIEQSGLRSGLLILNQADAAIAPQLVEPYKGALKLDPKPGTFAGGLIIRQDLVEENLTFETLLKNNRPEWIKLASTTLFAQNAVCAAAEGPEQ